MLQLCQAKRYHTSTFVLEAGKAIRCLDVLQVNLLRAYFVATRFGPGGIAIEVGQQKENI